MLYELSQIIFIIFCFYLPYMLYLLFNYEQKKPKIIVQEKIIYKTIQPKETREQIQPTPKQPKQQPQKIEEPKQTSAVYKDAMQVLKSLGMAKAQAEEKVERMFLKKDYKSIEDFLLDAYKID